MFGSFRTLSRKIVLAIMAASAGFAGMSLAHAEAPAADSSTYTTVRGIARFEKHRTVTPRLCTLEGCAQSQPYWALVVDAHRGEHYQIDQIFAVGQAQAPASVTLARVEIKPGMEISVQGHVDVESRAYAIVSGVESVQVGNKLEFSESSSTPFFGWTCHSVGENLPVYVDVEQVARDGGYAMRIQSETADSDSSPRTVASFETVSLSMSSTSIDFAGSTQLLHADLDIDQRSGRLSALDSVLRLNGKVRSSDSELPFELVAKRAVKLVCDRTR